MRLRNKSIVLRVTEEEQKSIDKKAAKAQLPREQYLRACALGKNISVIEDLRPVVSELKRIGNNLNQLTVLAHSGRINALNLAETNEALGRMYEAMISLVRESEDN